MSQLEVDKVIPQSGTTLTLGDSADTITIPSGATLDASSATLTLPDSSVSLAKLTATGTKDATTFLRGDNTFASAGLTEADSWRTNTNATFSNAGSSFVTTNWERVDTDGFDKIGTGLSESSGVFSFPSTGYYYINHWSSIQTTASRTYLAMQLHTTLNNSSYTYATQNYGNTVSGTAFTNNSSAFIFKVTDISNYKFKFSVDRSETCILTGDSDTNATGFTCIKLAGV
jgi:hypothetical protein